MIVVIVVKLAITVVTLFVVEAHVAQIVPGVVI